MLNQQFGLHRSILGIHVEGEAQFLADSAHLAILGQNRAHHALQFFIARHGNQEAVKFGAYTQALESVMHQNRKLGFVACMQFAQAAHRDNLRRARLVAMFHHQGQLAVVVLKTDAGQPLV